MISNIIRSERQVKLEISPNISDEVIAKVVAISNHAHRPEMQIPPDRNMKTLNDLIRVFGTSKFGTRILHGEDWFILYNNDNNNIEIFNMARIEPRFEDEHGDVIKELMDAFYHILDESIEDNKNIKAEFREDTSYLLYLYMLKSGVVTQIGDDYRNDTLENKGNYITKEEQMKKFCDIKKIHQNKEGKLYFHNITFIPSDSYIAKRKLTNEKTDINQGKAMI